MDVTQVSVRSRFALVATALALSPMAGAEEPLPSPPSDAPAEASPPAEAPTLDPSWRSPWTVSISAGVLPVHASTQTCIDVDSDTLAECPDPPEPETLYTAAVAVDVIVPFTVVRSAGGRFTLDVGPEGQVVMYVGWPGAEVKFSPSFAPAGGLSIGVRDRVSGPSVPGGKPGFEYGFRVGTLFGPGYNGVTMSNYGEVWTGWVLAPRWTPPAPEGLPAEPLSARRTAVVLGPYARGYYATALGPGSSVVGIGPSWSVEAGLRIDLRRETRLPPP